MADTTYTYSGPMSGVTLDNGREVLLYPNSTVELPEDNEYVKTLAALGYLAEAPAPAAPPRETKKKAKEVADNAS